MDKNKMYIVLIIHYFLKMISSNIFASEMVIHPDPEMSKSVVGPSFPAVCVTVLCLIGLMFDSGGGQAATSFPQEQTESDSASRLRSDINSTYAKDLDKKPEAANADFQKILERYIKIDMDFEVAARIIKKSGFYLTVFGKGAYAYPQAGVPAQGTKVTGILNIHGSLLAGSMLAVDLYPSEVDHFDRVKRITVRSSTSTP